MKKILIGLVMITLATMSCAGVEGYVESDFSGKGRLEKGKVQGDLETGDSQRSQESDVTEKGE